MDPHHLPAASSAILLATLLMVVAGHGAARAEAPTATPDSTADRPSWADKRGEHRKRVEKETAEWAEKILEEDRERRERARTSR